MNRAAPLLLALVALAGCAKSIDEQKAETFIDKIVTEQTGAEVKSVKCPTDVTAEKGGKFDCTVTGTDGTTGKINVTMKDDQGNVNASAPFLHVRELEDSIGSGLSEKLGAKVALQCPEIIVAEKGNEFECAATSGSDEAKVAVTQTDDQGNVRYKLVNT